MRKSAVLLLPILMIAGTIFAFDSYRRSLKLAPESSERFSRAFPDKTAVTVQLSGTDLGSGRIIAEVYDPKGKKIVSGTRRVSFNTGKLNGNYTIVVVNQTNKRQDVEVSVTSSPG